VTKLVNAFVRKLDSDGVIPTLVHVLAFLYQLILRVTTPYTYQVDKGLIEHSHYAYCCLHAANQAKALGINTISAIEFGCANGVGLIALEKITKKITRITGVKFEIYGFDSGEGLPAPKDYRDLPYHWKEGFFSMDQKALEAKLTKSQIIFGDVCATAKTFIDTYKPAIIGCIFHDLDYYSSTKGSFQIFNSDEKNFLPRIFNYFDDIIGTELELYNDWTGERLAIKEFNERNKNQKFSPAYHLTSKPNSPYWYHQIYIHHLLKHPNYNTYLELVRH